MTRTLVPRFIAERTHAQERNGSEPAASLFLDISGFTVLTSELMRHGKSGAETVSLVINRVFEPMIDAVHREGGFIASFAGDAFTAIFLNGGNSEDGAADARALDRAATAAVACRTVIDREHIQRTPFGDFSIEATIGLGGGSIDWGIVGPEEGPLNWYLRGQAVEEAIAAEEVCEAGQITISANSADSLGAAFLVREGGKEFARIQRPNTAESVSTGDASPDGVSVGRGSVAGDADASSSASPDVLAPGDAPEHDIQSRFRPPENYASISAGEFRDIVSAFIVADAGQTHEEIDETVGGVIRSAEEYGGYFDLLDFGDKGCVMLVLFGAPRSLGRNAERAARFGREILASLGDRCRIGLAGGVVFAGFVGGRTRATYTALGETVNRSARIAVAAASAEVLVEQEVDSSLDPATLDSETRALELKGFSEPVLVRSLSTKRDASEASTQLSRKRVLSGRESELSTLRSWLDDEYQRSTDEQKVRIMQITGDPGIGKSALVDAALTEHQGRRAIIRLSADPILRKSLNLFQGLVPALCIALGIDPPEAGSIGSWIESLVHRVETLDEELLEPIRESADALPVLERLPGGSRYEEREPRGRREMTFDAISNTLALLARVNRPIFVVDDLHAIDEDSAEALGSALNANTGEGISVILISRAAELPGSIDLSEVGESHRSMIQLGPLEEDALTGLAAAVLGGPADSALGEFLKARVGGNPFYADEMLRYLHDFGYLQQGPDGFTVPANQSGIPQNISAVLTERIDALPQRVRELCAAAAIIGLEFDAETVRMVHAVDDPDSALEEGRTARLWECTESGAYRFTQSLVREAIVAMQLDSERERLHSSVFDALYSRFGDDPSHAAELAYHANRGDRRAETLQQLWRAYEYACEHYLNEKAVEFLREYLAQCVSNDEKLRAFVEIGHIYDITGDWDKATDALTYGLGAAVLTEDLHARSSILTSLTGIHQRMGRTREAMRIGQQSVETAQMTDDAHLTAEALLSLARAQWAEGRLQEAEHGVSKAIKAAQQAADPKNEGLALYLAGVIHRDRNDYPRARELYRQAESRLQAYGDQQLTTYPLYDLAVLMQYEGDLERSQEYFERVLEVYRKTGYRSGASAAVLNLGVLRDRRGDFAGAIELFEEAREIAESTGEQLAIAYTLFSIGATYYKMDDNRKALYYLRDSLRIMRDLGARGYYGYPLSYLCALYARTGNTDRVISLCSYHLAAVREVGSDPENGLALLSLARTLRKAAPKSPEAPRDLSSIADYYGVDIGDMGTLFRKAIEISQQARYVNTLIPARYHYSRYLSDSGHESEASKELREAYRLAKAATWERFVDSIGKRHGDQVLDVASHQTSEITSQTNTV